MAAPAPAAAAAPPTVVELQYADLKGPPTPATIAAIARAFAYDGLGLLTVAGVPGFAEARAAALPFAHAIATLPEDAKVKLEHKDSYYSFGWSHGRENFNGQPDTGKGSFYFNPVEDAPGGADVSALPKDLLPFLHPNIWPAADVCPGFEAATKRLAGLMVGVGGELARHVDAYVAQHRAAAAAAAGVPAAAESAAAALPAGSGGGGGGGAAQPPYTLENIVKRCRTHKARLLYYFPPPAPAPAAAAAAAAPVAPEAPWCGAHNDHGSLTALTSALFFQHASGEVLAQGCPDPQAGLYIKTRCGQTVRAPIPAGSLAFQIGECAQIQSGGALQATPHWVQAPRGEASAGVGRGTMAVFMCVAGLLLPPPPRL